MRWAGASSWDLKLQLRLHPRNEGVEKKRLKKCRARDVFSPGAVGSMAKAVVSTLSLFLVLPAF